MEDAVPLLLFLGFLFGPIVLILVFGCPDLAARLRDQESAEEPRPDMVAERPRFFVDVEGERDAPISVTTWAPPWGSVEAHLRHEHEMASAFVAAPSLQMLFAHSTARPASCVGKLEKYIRDETRLVSDLIHRHPASSLYPHTRSVTFVPQQQAALPDAAHLGLHVGGWQAHHEPRDAR